MNAPVKPNKQLLKLVPIQVFDIHYHGDFISLDKMQEHVNRLLEESYYPTYKDNYDLKEPFKVDLISIEKDYGYDNYCSVSLVFTVKGLLEPKDLKKRQAKFDKDMEKYEQDLKDYKAFQLQQKDVEEQKLFLKLKKKYEKGN